MHLRSSKNNTSFVSLDNKVHKKTISKKTSLAISPISPLAKKVILKNAMRATNETTDEATNETTDEIVKSNANQQVSHSIELDPKMDLIQMIRRYNKNLEFFKKMLILKSQMELDLERLEQVHTVEITNFETMSFVCPELKYWSAQF